MSIFIQWLPIFSWKNLEIESFVEKISFFSSARELELSLCVFFCLKIQNEMKNIKFGVVLEA